jgi:hypothetical protein
MTSVGSTMRALADDAGVAVDAAPAAHARPARETSNPRRLAAGRKWKAVIQYRLSLEKKLPTVRTQEASNRGQLGKAQGVGAHPGQITQNV